MNKDDICYFVLLRGEVNNILAIGAAFSLVFIIENLVLVNSNLRTGEKKVYFSASRLFLIEIYLQIANFHATNVL